MSRFSGPQHRGAMRTFRQVARTEAETRQESERIRDQARAMDREVRLRQWRRSPQGRAARRFWRDFERRLGHALAQT